MTMDSDNPYDLLALDSDEGHRWAFGTGFTDPLAGIDTTVPDGLDAAALARYCLALGDDALVLSHRLQEWVTRLPELEEETAVANIALDLLGQARMLLARAGAISGRTEDELAFFRVENEFRNVRMVERENGDFADLVARLLVFASWRLELMCALSSTADPVLAAIAAKSVPELAYHRDYAAQWVIRLGDGTELSHERMQAALERLWPWVDELFADDADAPSSVDESSVRAVLDQVFATAGVKTPQLAGIAGAGGRTGVHTEALGYVLAELQSVARQYPDATW
jgi:ring-1,2-phenylacetyl-CoA epoxidase subunit PaaC